MIARGMIKISLLFAAGMLGGHFLVRRPAAKPFVRPTAESLGSRVIRDARLGRTTYGQSVEFLRSITDANIVVNWHDLARHGIRPDDPLDLDLSLHGATAAQWLDLWSEIAGTQVQLRWRLTDGVIVVRALDRQYETFERETLPMNSYCHDARDLISQISGWEHIVDDGSKSSSHPTADPRRELLKNFLHKCLYPGNVRNLFINPDGFLIIDADDETQNAVEQILDILRHPADHGSPP